MSAPDDDILVVDWSQIFEPQPPPNWQAESEPYYARLLLTFGDVDYILFRGLALAGVQRESLFHLHQTVEKHLKAILLAHEQTPRRGRAGHDLELLVADVARLCPELSHPSVSQFCWLLTPWQQYGHYPEAVLDYPRLRPQWNERSRDGLMEADLFVATLRATAISAMGGHADSAFLLESVLHRDMIPFMDGCVSDPTQQLQLRTWLTTANKYFTPATLPTEHQRYQLHLAFPLEALPNQNEGLAW